MSQINHTNPNNPNNPNKNWDCCNDKCRAPHGEVRVYPLGGGANLILCQACWAHENRYRYERGRETGHPEDFPQRDWTTAETYGGRWGILARRDGASAWCQQGEAVLLFDNAAEARAMAADFNARTSGISYVAARYE
jgi:hypothetical protein